MSDDESDSEEESSTYYEPLRRTRRRRRRVSRRRSEEESASKKIRITKEDWNSRTERKRREEGSDSTLNMAVLEFLVADGRKDAAIAFREEAGLKDCVLDLDSIERRSKVLESIRRGEIPEVLEMLKREMSNDEMLRFELHNHTLIELIRRGESMRALEHARTHMRWVVGNEEEEKEEEKYDTQENQERRSRFERTMGLLAFENPETSSPDSSLFDQVERERIANLANRAMLNKEPELRKVMKLLDWTQSQVLETTKELPVVFDVRALGVDSCWISSGEKMDEEEDDDDGVSEKTCDNGDELDNARRLVSVLNTERT